MTAPVKDRPATAKEENRTVQMPEDLAGSRPGGGNLHQILHQMNALTRFCFDFRADHLLLSVSLGRSMYQNGASMVRSKVLKSTSVFFNQGRSRPGQIG
ncbi:hypothetical protein I5R65_12790 [Herbaspirillum sp. AP02]|uniref:hypothetical protein n=1 Tax=unclassified Herbaspirillum TaxID=2624150 RepID=UPI0015D9A039|nr:MULTISPECIES: hypothetical protein [unclassified Herbaspirillum]MBG7620345.1 hypothetical protein [Herbaspirillum sp. AP02]NZD67809.1 hypothetical protein [Herbaspirillum sp. AP21]